VTELSANHRFVLDWVRREIGPGRPVLDYGCGEGEVVEAALADGLDLFGVDLFYDGGAAKAAVEQRGLVPGRVLELAHGRIPHPDGRFDAVISNQVLEHVEDLGLVLDEVRRVLKPGGRFLALFPLRETWREGHVGIPFLHRLPPGRLRSSYTRAWRRLGLGFNKEEKTVESWSADAERWVDTFTRYRRWAEIERELDRHFAWIERVEQQLLQFRLTGRPGRRLIERLPEAVARRAVVALAGVAFVATRP
jgi:SAM-dependent methyltransferase